MDMGRAVVSIIAGAIAIILSFSLFETIVEATDEFYLTTVAHCEVNGNRFTTVFEADTGGGFKNNTGFAVSEKTGGGCTATPASVTANSTSIDEHGEAVGTFPTATTWTPTTGAIWRDVLGVMKQFNGINQLVLSVLPILIVASYLGITGANLLSYSRGGIGNTAMLITTTIVSLLIIIVVLEIAPDIMAWANDVFVIVDSGRLSVTNQFGSLLVLVLGFFPVVFIAGLMVLYSQQGLLSRSTSRLLGGMRGGRMRR